MSLNNQGSGQSIVEIVFAIGVLGLILGGAVMLLTKTISVRGGAFERKKAVELGTAVMEELVAQQSNSPGTFWQLADAPFNTRAGYPGYVYSIGFTNITTGGNCGAGGAANCAVVNIRVGWTADVSKYVEFSKFMTR